MPYKQFTAAVLTVADVNDYLMEQARVICTSGTRPSSPIEGMHIYETDTDRSLEYSGSAWVVPGAGQWTTFTASVSQNVTPTQAAATAEYERVGKRVTGTIFCPLTSAGTASQQITATLPVGPRHNSSGFVVGSFWFLDASTSTTYVGTASFLSSGAVIRFHTNSSTDAFGISPGITIANGDVLSCAFTYEAA